MEIMGLLVVIILLTIGLLLVMQFVVLKKPSEIKQRQEQSQLAANLINSMLQASTTCNDYTIRELIQNCASRNDINCKCGALSCRSCEFAFKTIFYIVNQTLIDWKMSFNLSVSGTQISIFRGDCSGEKELKWAPIHVPGKTVIVDLELCRPEEV